MARHPIRAGRWTHDHSGGLVVFMIGMRVNQPWRVRAWWPVFTAFPRMLNELSRDPDSGLLGHTGGIRGRGGLTITYWRDLEALLTYAHSTDHEHRPAWAAFNRRSRQAGNAVGIWHETFVVPAGGHESLYAGMPSVGLPQAVGAVEVSSRNDSLRARMVRG